MQCPPSLKAHNHSFHILSSSTGKNLLSHLKFSFLVGSGWDLGKTTVQNFLSVGQQVPGWQKKFLGAKCHFLNEMFYRQTNRVCTKIEGQLDFLVGDCEDKVA